MSVFKVGGGNCPVCDWKLFVIGSSSDERAHEIMSLITKIYEMESFMYTDSPHYQAVYWKIFVFP